MSAVEAELRALFARVLRDEAFVPDRAMETGAHPNWDSIANVEILVSCEERWGFEFASAEIDRIRSFGDLVDAVHAHAG